ncbi:branched-chain amino acid ABC transporter permease [Geminicoccaceae bacterium 1502E]|nr:branched-chain amino acid ABC transporter permease [Geminicoccaceae bacterium 1502E]
MTADLLLQGLINGLILGLIYSLIGLSLNIIFGVLRVVNFAHGEFIILGAYAAYFLQRLLGLSPFLAMPVIFVMFALIGWALYFVLVKRLTRSDDPETASLLVMFGLSITLGALMLFFFEADARSLDYMLEPPFLMFGNIVIPTTRLVALAITLVITGITAWFLYRTFPGKALRAVIMNRSAVATVGIDVEKLSAMTFGIGLGFAGVTGVLLAMIFPAFSPFAGADYTLIGFIIIVLGGLGHPIGALVGGLLFGVTEQVTVVLADNSVALLVGFALMIAVIFFRPSGLFGRQQMR